MNDKIEAEKQPTDNLNIDQLMASIQGEIAKKRVSMLRQVLTTQVERRTQHELSINQIDREIAKIVEDAKSGVFPAPQGKGGGQQGGDAKKAE